MHPLGNEMLSNMDMVGAISVIATCLEEVPDLIEFPENRMGICASYVYPVR